MAINLNEDKPQAQAMSYPAEHGQQLKAMFTSPYIYRLSGQTLHFPIAYSGRGVGKSQQYEPS
ncbi:hypothetical protein NEUTE2DRAFT_143168 [Neurospora tetrasperma FGSC 2509]|nr:hypothetical protein NEUTE2DRAFT_143168 [Neurospora tetrasperma FGSC 2509]